MSFFHRDPTQRSCCLSIRSRRGCCSPMLSKIFKFFKYLDNRNLITGSFKWQNQSIPECSNVCIIFCTIKVYQIFIFIYT